MGKPIPSAEKTADYNARVLAVEYAEKYIEGIFKRFGVNVQVEIHQPSLEHEVGEDWWDTPEKICSRLKDEFLEDVAKPFLIKFYGHRGSCKPL